MGGGASFQHKGECRGLLDTFQLQIFQLRHISSCRALSIADQIHSMSSEKLSNLPSVIQLVWNCSPDLDLRPLVSKSSDFHLL